MPDGLLPMPLAEPPLETELKLALDPALVRRFTRIPALTAHRQGRGKTRMLAGTYFDTADRDLKAAEASLRVRRTGQTYSQTLKAPSGDRHARHEWETAIPGPELDLALLADGLARVGLAPDAVIGPLFTTDVRRTTWPVRLPDGSAVEVALDRGAVIAGDRRADLCEVELELKEGDPAALYDLALALLREVPLRLEPRAKADRGYDLVDGVRAPPKPAPVDLSGIVDVETAFKTIARTCLAHLDRSESAALAGDDPEGVHQVRVALRRLRSAFTLFRPVLPPLAAAFAQDLRDLAGACGPARDWDVFAADVLRPLRTQRPADEALEILAMAVERARELGYAQARAALTAPTYTELQLRLGRWLATPWPAESGRPTLADFAAAVLQRRYRKLKKRMAHLGRTSSDELHEVRIEAKKLRYAIEFFRTLYRRKATRTLSVALMRLQDILGTLNDAAVGAVLLNRLEETAPLPPRAPALVEGWYAARIAALLPGLPAARDEFAAAKRFWPRPAKRQSEQADA